MCFSAFVSEPAFITSMPLEQSQHCRKSLAAPLLEACSSKPKTLILTKEKHKIPKR